jgi:hypothetical protein
VRQYRRFSSFGCHEAIRYVKEGKSLPPSTEIEAQWTESSTVHGNRALLDAWLDTAEGRAALPEDVRDGLAASSLHAALQLPRRTAVDRPFWCWLAACAGATYTNARWQREEREGRFSHERIGRNFEMNALARLWWGAEQTRVENPRALRITLGLSPSDDPYCFAKELFVRGDVAEVLLKRSFAQVAGASIAFVVVALRKKIPQDLLGQFIRSVHLSHSTVILETFVAEADFEKPYYVEPTSCARLVRHYEFLADEILQAAQEAEEMRAERKSARGISGESAVPDGKAEAGETRPANADTATPSRPSTLLERVRRIIDRRG